MHKKTENSKIVGLNDIPYELYKKGFEAVINRMTNLSN